MQEHKLQFARLLREAGSEGVLEALAEYCEACAEQLLTVDKKRRAELFLGAGSDIMAAMTKVAEAERIPKGMSEAPCTLADAAEEDAGLG